MAAKAIELVRTIRDKHYEETKKLSVEEQIKFVKDQSKEIARNTREETTIIC
jgi:deoxyadenosine/deoxycytidine kinase